MALGFAGARRARQRRRRYLFSTLRLVVSVGATALTPLALTPSPSPRGPRGRGEPDPLVALEQARMGAPHCCRTQNGHVIRPANRAPLGLHNNAHAVPKAAPWALTCNAVGVERHETVPCGDSQRGALGFNMQRRWRRRNKVIETKRQRRRMLKPRPTAWVCGVFVDSSPNGAALGTWGCLGSGAGRPPILWSVIRLS